MTVFPVAPPFRAAEDPPNFGWATGLTACSVLL